MPCGRNPTMPSAGLWIELRDRYPPRRGPGSLARAFLLQQVSQLLGLTARDIRSLDENELLRLEHAIASFDQTTRRRLFHLAYERRYRIQVLDALAAHVPVAAPPAPARPLVQAIFCIDERCESFRRLSGTLSFVADDLIVSGSLDEQLHAGLLVIAATVLSGIAMVRGWFYVFGGPVAPDGPRHAILTRERVAFSALLFALFALGMVPAPLVRSLERAAGQLLGKPVAAAPDSRPAAQESEGLRLHDSRGRR
jgi:hypothetical protein